MQKYIIEETITQKVKKEVMLLPCPFCGGEAEIRKQHHCGGRKGSDFEYTPRCKKTSCAGRLTKKWLNETDAVKAWNGIR